MLNIINKSKLELPDYLADSLRELCWKAHIAPSDIVLIVKQRNRYVSERWIKKGNRDIPSGTYHNNYRTITILIGKHTLKEDLRFVLAHEIGHLKQHKEAGALITAGDYQAKMPKPETYATKFAVQDCNCYPRSIYTGINKHKRGKQ